MRLMLAQLNPIIGDIQGNLHKMLDALEKARQEKVDGVVFPELSLCGYPPEDLLMHASFIKAQQEALKTLVDNSQGLIVLAGVVRPVDRRAAKRLFNSVAVIENGHLLGFADKQLLPTYDVFDEARYFEPGPPCRLWTLQGKKVGILICEDMWQHTGFVEHTDYAVDPVLQLKALQPDFVINMSASPYRSQKSNVRLAVGIKAAQTLQVPILFCCQVGGNDQLIFDGYSYCINPQGKLCALAKGFQEDWMVVDTERLGKEVVFAYDPWEDLFQALVLGVKDYLHKQGFSKGCLGLSGGIDSALVAAIAVEALGKENVLCVLMPSRFTSQQSIDDARLLSKRLGVELYEIGIEKPFEDVLGILKPFFKNTPPDVTEENMQARLRGLILMSLSNKFGHIVLSTGNKSELGTGYCTLYGDMCGGLSVISDVTKHEVYQLCYFLNRKQELIPKGILERPPSAELRYDQKDTDTLPAYDIVDAVVKGYVEQCLSPEEISEQEDIPLPVVLDLIAKIHRAEYKRRQAAPGIRVSKKAFRVGRRYPIVQKWI
ncbi:MAG: putative glutamine-dependent synthetase [Chlamydiota bacterium]|jgi:NAD+ synthase (glutamine-hydrolysing)